MPATYDKIATYTVPSSTSSYTFTSIAGTYTDLVLITSTQGVSGSPQNLIFQLNSDTGSNYSTTWLTGDGTAASSTRLSSRTNGYFDYSGYPPVGSNFNIAITQFNNYSNSTTNKTVIGRSNNAASGLDATVNLWRSTAAITSIKIYFSSNNISTGSTFTLYGIKAA